MPRMDGFELAELMRGSERTREVPIIFVTAAARDQHRQMCIRDSLSYRALEGSADSARRVTHTLEVVEQLQALLSTLQDAETGQRGFLLTGHEDYLVPYTTAKAALAGEFTIAHGLIDGTPQQKRRLDALERVAAEKMEELGETVALRLSLIHI